jgi:hypothetical protein
MMNLSSLRIFLSENNGLDCDSFIFFLINFAKTKQYSWFYYKEQSVIFLYRRSYMSAMIVYINLTNKKFIYLIREK